MENLFKVGFRAAFRKMKSAHTPFDIPRLEEEAWHEFESEVGKYGLRMDVPDKSL